MGACTLTQLRKPEPTVCPVCGHGRVSLAVASLAAVSFSCITCGLAPIYSPLGHSLVAPISPSFVVQVLIKVSIDKCGMKVIDQALESVFELTKNSLELIRNPAIKALKALHTRYDVAYPVF